MKKNFYVFGLLIIFLCSFQNAFGQQVGVIPQSSANKFKELGDLKIKANDLRRIKSYRMQETTEVFDEKGESLKARYISTHEVMPSDRRYYKVTSEIGGVTKKGEYLIIGKDYYRREDGGNWKLFKPQPGKTQTIIGVGSVSNVKVLEETTLNGQPVKVYYEEKFDSIGDVETSSKTKYWFTTEGELLKTEAEITNSKNKEISRRTTLYEFDANINVEAPVK